MVRTRVAFVFVWFGLWLLLSGHWQPFLLVMGAASALLVSAAAASLPRPNGRWLGWILYAPWLLWRIVLANLHVAGLICRPRSALRPRLLRYHTKLSTPSLRVLLCQSITLTPGTITTDLNEATGEVTVHAIDSASGEDLVQGRLEQALRNAYRDRGRR